MSRQRARLMRRNLKLMFWVRAFINLTTLNIVVTLFYLHRGLNLQQVFFLSIVWAAVNIIFEVPSSYLADKWGRKKTIILGLIIGQGWVMYLFAHSFAVFAISLGCTALQYACLSGTDEAVVYDSHKELGEASEGSLHVLGKFYSALSFFKIITPLIGLFIFY